ncbi:MMPL family transporter [Gammaproteobacteria bacterium]|nr:MMPL family transporter [Gammaproteobacteria bacterium]MDB4059723.1 MMPL family transporter [Gammaproteobacteria bacterium]MDC1191189.1 MMPL family transporter [Gammaproteobacteria bacterium]
MQPIHNYIQLILANPIRVLLLVFLTLIISSLGLTNFKLDASSDALVLENDTAFKIYRESGEEFGESDFLIVTYSPYKELFSVNSLTALKSLETDLGMLDGVENVFSLLDAPIFFQPKVPLADVADNLKDLESPEINLLLAKEEFLENPIYKDLIISSDGKTTALQLVIEENIQKNILINKRYQALEAEVRDASFISALSEQISILNDEESSAQKKLVKEIRSTLVNYKDKADLFLGGPSMIAVDMMAFIQSDLIIFGIGVALIFAIMLYIFFGNFWFVILPLINAFVTTIFTAGFLGLMNWKISVVSSNFIALLLILTISLTVHVMVKFIDNNDADKRKSLQKTFSDMFLPCMFAALTTAIAFLSLTLGDLKPVIEFGKMMAVGMAFALFFTFTFLPAALMAINTGKTKDFIDVKSYLNSIARFTKGNNLFLLASYAILLSIFLFGMSKLLVENRFIDYFDESTEIYQGMLLLDEELGGTATLDIIIKEPALEIDDSIYIDDDLFGDDLFEDEESEASGYWWNIYSLNKLEDIHDYLDAMPEIGKVLSVASGVKLARKINDNEDLNDLELALLRSVLPEDIRETLLYSYINKDDSKVRISARVIESAESLNRKELLLKIEDDLVNKFNLSKDQFEITGLAVLYNNMLQSLFSSQIGSLALVFAVIALMLLILFRSIKIMIIGVLPNIFVASSVLGLLGLLKIPLDIMTITVASISVGMAVDNTIHYLYRYRSEIEAGNTPDESMLLSHLSVGRAIFYTAFTIAIGFSILSLSNFAPTALFGIFTAIALLLAFVSSLTLLPLLLVRLKVFI